MKVEIKKVEKTEDEKAVIETRQMTLNVRRAADLLRSEEMTLTGIRDDNTYEIPAHLVYYIERDDQHTRIHTKKYVFDTEERFQDLQKRMDEQFLKCTKNCIVNVHKMMSVKSNGSHRLRATLLNGETLELDRTCVPELKQILGISGGAR